jgi:hypothetical protein
MSQRGDDDEDEHDGPKATSEWVDAPRDFENGPDGERSRGNSSDNGADGGARTERDVDDRGEQVDGQRDVRPLQHCEPSRLSIAKQPDKCFAQRWHQRIMDARGGSDPLTRILQGVQAETAPGSTDKC